MIGVRDLSLVALGLLACPAAWAQTAPDPAPPQPPRATFRSGVDVVALNVTVLDSTQRLVGDLARHDFAVFEDGVRQDIAYFETRDIPLDVALLIDTSISMGPSLPTVRRAAAGLVAMLRPLDRAAVFGFNDRVHKFTGFTSDSEVITRAIGDTRSNGATALYNAIYVALREFRNSITTDDTVRRRAIVVLSDGEDTASVLSFDELLAEARRAGVTIYTIGLRWSSLARCQAALKGRNSFSNADYELRALAQETGATVHFPTREADLSLVYNDIGRELAQQYAIGYVSRNPVQNGKFRRVIVQVVNRPEMRPRTRPGYVAGLAPAVALAITSTP